jgi:hypothetical protein
MADPFPFVASTVLTAAQLNGIGEAWTSYVPTVKGGTTSVTGTLSYSKYLRINKLVFVQTNITITSAGDPSGIISVSMPSGLLAVSQDVTRPVGSFFVFDASASSYYQGVATAVGNNIQGVSYNSSNYMGNVNPGFALANGDKVSFSVCYEVA